MKKKRGISKKKYILGILCIVVFLVTFVSAGVNLFAANSDRGIYYRNDLSGTYISAAEARAVSSTHTEAEKAAEE